MQKPRGLQYLLLLLPIIAIIVIVRTRPKSPTASQDGLPSNIIVSPCCASSPRQTTRSGDIPILSVHYQAFDQPGMFPSLKSFKSRGDILMDGAVWDTKTGIKSYVRADQMRNISALVDLRKARPISHAEAAIRIIGAVQYTILLVVSPDGKQWHTQARRGPFGEGRYRVSLMPWQEEPSRYAEVILVRSNGYGESTLEWTDLRLYDKHLIPFSPSP